MWMPFPSASYGICYTFNSARNTEDSNVPRKSSLTGSANGLTIEIFVDQVLVQSGCEEGIVNFFLIVTQAVALYCSCHAAQVRGHPYMMSALRGEGGLAQKKM